MVMFPNMVCDVSFAYNPSILSNITETQLIGQSIDFLTSCSQGNNFLDSISKISSINVPNIQQTLLDGVERWYI